MELSIAEEINNKIKSPARGFTLIELLVVISIISVISMVGLVSYTNFLKSSRDSKRQADLKFIQSALEEYHADTLYYPFAVTPGSSIAQGGKTYMTTVPSDPKGTPNYSYVPSGTGCAAATPQSCTSYCLYASLEGTNIHTSDAVCPTGSTYNYGITKP